MMTFGEKLRFGRQNCYDPDNPGQRLSQQQLGKLLGQELELRTGYSGAAISDWERGKSKINADERLVLVSLLKVLYQCGGLKTIADADSLLETGNYRALNDNEKQRASQILLPD
jgi:hypothetical protein